jgi:hypothetical protein
MVAGFLALLPATARAEDAVKGYPPCDRTPTEGDVTAAKGAFQAGNGSFNEADYGRALDYWEDAYRRDCTAHPLLLNLARAYELNGQKRHAVTALRTFLERSPGSSEEGQIKRRVEKLDEQIRAEDTAAQAPVAAPQPAMQPVMQPAPAPAPAESPSGGKRSIVPLIVAGGGAAVGVVGLVVDLTAQSDINAADKACPGRKACPASVADQGNSARTRATVGTALMIVGGAAVVGGLVWYFVQKPEQTASVPRGFSASVSPVWTPAFSGLAVDGSF